MWGFLLFSKNGSNFVFNLSYYSTIYNFYSYEIFVKLSWKRSSLHISYILNISTMHEYYRAVNRITILTNRGKGNFAKSNVVELFRAIRRSAIVLFRRVRSFSATVDRRRAACVRKTYWESIFVNQISFYSEPFTCLNLWLILLFYHHFFLRA